MTSKDLLIRFRSSLLHDFHVSHSCRYNSAFWAPGESRTERYDEYEVCIALKSTGDLADWTEADCYEPKGYICKIEGMISNISCYLALHFHLRHLLTI